MDTLAKLIRKRKLAKICRIGVWIIAIIGVVHIASQAYTLWQTANQPSGGNITEANQLYIPSPLIFLDYLPTLLQSAVLYLFCCIVLYCASVVFESISAPEMKSKEENNEPGRPDFEEESIVYTSLKPEEIRRDKKLNHQ